MTDALWITGLFGGALGGALAYPLVAHRPSRTTRPGFLLGLLLTLAATLAGLVSLRHGDLLGPADRVVSHLVNIVGLCLGPVFLAWLGAFLRTPAPAWQARAAWLPLASYVVAMPLLPGGRTPHFAWLLPVIVCVTIAGFARWRAASRSGSAPAQSLAFAAGLVLFSAALNVALALRTFLPATPVTREIVPLTLTCGFIALCVYSMRGLAAGISVRLLGAPDRYARSAMTDDAGRDVLARLDRIMGVERAFVRADLTLAGAASLTGVTPHELSEALNRLRGVPFLQYLAGLRVAEARRQLADTANDGFTIEGIAQSCGFASRSAFYSAFRRVEGITPTEFRRRARQGSA